MSMVTRMPPPREHLRYSNAHARATAPSSVSKPMLRKGSFRRWIAEQVAQDDAARCIQLFLRAKLATDDDSSSSNKLGKLEHTASVASCASTVNSSVSSASSSSSSSLYDDVATDAVHDEREVFVWHGAMVGLEFDACPITGYPRVIDDSSCNDALPGMWSVRNGDFLVAVNDCSTHSDILSAEQVVQIIDNGMRPAILRFRRPDAHEMEKAVMIRSQRLHASSTTAATMQRKQQQRRRERRERLEQAFSYIVWREEDATLGIGLKRDKKRPYPVVSEIGAHGAVGRQAERSPLSVGDNLVSINHLDVAQLGVKRAIAMLQFAPRPLVLTFRRCSSAGLSSEPRSLDL